MCVHSLSYNTVLLLPCKHDVIMTMCVHIFPLNTVMCLLCECDVMTKCVHFSAQNAVIKKKMYYYMRKKMLQQRQYQLIQYLKTHRETQLSILLHQHIRSIVYAIKEV